MVLGLRSSAAGLSLVPPSPSRVGDEVCVWGVPSFVAKVIVAGVQVSELKHVTSVGSVARFFCKHVPHRGSRIATCWILGRL